MGPQDRQPPSLVSDSNLTFYDLLGVSPQATPAEIEGAYRALLIKVHPDISRLDNLDTHRLMAAVNEAWLTLKDPEKRTAYDELLTDPTKKTPSQAPAQSYMLEELSDRGKSYVEQLDKFRAHWEEERKKAEEERIERERLALAAQEARDNAWRVRRTMEQSVRDRVEPPTAAPWPIWLGAGIAVILAAASVWLLWPRQTPSSTAPAPTTPLIAPAPTPQKVRPSPRATKATAITAATATPVAAAATAQPPRAAASPSAAPTAPPTPKPRVHVNPPAVLPRPSAQPAHQASTCREALVTSVNGPILATSAGSYRVADPTMQQVTIGWKAGDSITICPQTASDGSQTAIIANGVRGTVQAAPLGASAPR
jgi:curved DNA-binding protein CbpA